METISLKEIENINTTQLSCAALKKHITEMLASSSQCQAILECINQETGEYRIVLQGILDSNFKRE
ncbi:MAG: hypothetical protein ACE5HI_17535 [bacterium]